METIPILTDPGPDFHFQADDIAFLIGDRPQVDRALFLLNPSLEKSR